MSLRSGENGFNLTPQQWDDFDRNGPFTDMPDIDTSFCVPAAIHKNFEIDKEDITRVPENKLHSLAPGIFAAAPPLQYLLGKSNECSRPALTDCSLTGGRPLSEVFPCLSPSLRSLRSVSWNVRSLCPWKPATRSAMLNEIRALSRNRDILNLQEVKGTPTSIRNFLKEFNSKFWIFMSHFELCRGDTIDLSWSSFNRGGLATLIRKDAFGPFAVPVETRVFAEGRMMKSSLWIGSAHVAVYNLHIFDLQPAQMNDLALELVRDIDLARRGQASVLVQGDVNAIRANGIDITLH